MSAQMAPIQWLAEPYGGVRLRAAPRLPMVVFGLLVTAGLPIAAWFTLAPMTMVQTRFVADIAGPAARAMLAEAALRLAAARWVSAILDGDSLVITVSDANAAKAQALMRSVSAAVLDMAVPINGAPPPASPERPYSPAAPPPVMLPNAAVRERDRLRSSLDTADARLASLSSALTGITRDIAAGARAAPDRRAGRETLDKATLALADLQLQRIQLQSRYQDDFPAVVVLDGQIRSVRTLITDETRRIDLANRVPADPADPLLGAERDRLRAEQTQWLDRRATIAGELAVAGHRVIEAVREPAPIPLEPKSNPVVTAPIAPVPMLVAAATTLTSDPDIRWWALPAAGGLGLMAWLTVWFGPARRFRAMRAELVLQRLEGLMLTPIPALPSQQADRLLRARAEAALLLRTSHGSYTSAPMG